MPAKCRVADTESSGYLQSGESRHSGNGLPDSLCEVKSRPGLFPERQINGLPFPDAYLSVSDDARSIAIVSDLDSSS